MPELIEREVYEWANIWWDHANDASLPRVLLIGDSISVSYSPTVTERLEGMARVDRLSNSRSINDPALFREILYMLGEYRYRAIHFNNGLHGWHIADDVYADSLRRYVQLLVQYAPEAKLIWASSTPVYHGDGTGILHDEKTAQIRRRNAAAAGVMAEYGIPVNDLFALTIDRQELFAPDGVHFAPEGQRMLGDAVGEMLAGVVGKQT